MGRYKWRKNCFYRVKILKKLFTKMSGCISRKCENRQSFVFKWKLYEINNFQSGFLWLKSPRFNSKQSFYYSKTNSYSIFLFLLLQNTILATITGAAVWSDLSLGARVTKLCYINGTKNTIQCEAGPSMPLSVVLFDAYMGPASHCIIFSEPLI